MPIVKYNLILTSGSDYHGDSSLMSNEHKLGANNCDEIVVERLRHVLRALPKNPRFKQK